MIRNVDLKNEEFLSILDEVSNTYFDEKYVPLLTNSKIIGCFEKEGKRETLTDEYLEKLMDTPEKHEGYPESMRGFFALQTGLYQDSIRMNPPKGTLDLWRELIFRCGKLTKEIECWLSTRNEAYFTYYPEDGYIGWHNNQNASGYNFILSYSETGTGFFEYVDPETKEKVVCQDEKQKWTCKAGYFGSLKEDNKLLWHKAEANGGRRITISYVVPSESLWSMTINDLETP